MNADASDRQVPEPHVHLDIDTAERLVQLASRHAQGLLSDVEFHDQREQLLTQRTTSSDHSDHGRGH